MAYTGKPSVAASKHTLMLPTTRIASTRTSVLSRPPCRTSIKSKCWL